MRFRTTLIAFLLLVLSGILVYVFEFRWTREKEEREAEARKIFSVDWGDLQGVRITGSHGTVLLERKPPEGDARPGDDARGSGWRVVEPVRTDADDGAILGLMTALKNLEQERVIQEGPADLAPFGLAAPGLRVELVLAEGRKAPAPLLIGEKSPVGENAYAMREGEAAVLLLSAYANPQIDKSVYDLREKRLFRTDKRDIERVEVLQGGRVRLDLVRQDDRWSLAAPIRAPVSREEADKILDKVSGLTARSFEDAPAGALETYGLAEPRREVRLTLGPDRTVASLLLGAGRLEEGRELVYAKRGEAPQIVSLDADLLETLDRDPEDLRDRKVFPFQSWKVARVEMSLNGEAFTLVKTGTGTWRIAGPLDARASSGKVSSFLSALSRLEGTAFFEKPEAPEDWKRYGLDTPSARLTLFEEAAVPVDGESAGAAPQPGPVPIGTLLLGRPGGEPGTGYAWKEGSETLAEVESTFFREHLSEHPEAFRDRRVLDFQRYLAAAVEFRGPDGETTLLEEKDGAWTIEKPVSRPVDPSLVDDLLDLLSEMEVERFAAVEPGLPAGPRAEPAWAGSPAWSLSVKDEGGRVLGSVLFSAEGPAEEPDLRYVWAVEDREIGLIGAEQGERVLERIRGIRAVE